MQFPAINPSITYTPNQTLARPATSANGAIKQPAASTPSTESKETKENNKQELSEGELRQVEQLKRTDREVRAHEAAHISAGGGVVRGGATYSYQTGPDGRAYAVGGEVSIDTSPVDDNPQATILKARTIRAAALAPANPSSADHAVAAAASQLEAAAAIELAAKKAEELQDTPEESSTKNAETETDSEKSEKLSTQPNNSDSGINRYQNVINANTAPDTVGQLINTSA